MEYVLLTIQLLIGLGIFLGWLWLRQLPAAIHKRQEQLFQQQLAKEIELLKISRSEIQIRKVERFIDFAKIQTEILTDAKFKKKIEANDPKAISTLREQVVELGIGLFFFASDATIRMYADWKVASAKKGADPIQILSSLGDLMLELRKDVGYEDTYLSGADYL